MTRFYALVARRHGAVRPGQAARLDVDGGACTASCSTSDGEWPTPSLVAALAALYSYVYAVPRGDVRLAAEQRALAMRHSDRWVREGCRLDSALVPAERAALVRSYAALLAAVHVE